MSGEFVLMAVEKFTFVKIASFSMSQLQYQHMMNHIHITMISQQAMLHHTPR